MPSALTREEVARVAALARIELDDREEELYARQLADFLAYADAMRVLDTADVPPTASVLARQPPLRADEVRPSLSIGDALANAPDPAPEAGLFRVPRVIGG